MTDPFDVLSTFEITPGKKGFFYSLPELEKQGAGPISRLPFSIRVVLESVLRNCDGRKITQQDVMDLAKWNAKKTAAKEVPFVVARIVLQDFTGVPLLVDLAAMRSTVLRLGGNPSIVEPLVPVDLVVDHSVQVDYYGRADAIDLNLEMEFQRNRERYEFLKWGQQAFKTFRIVPPGIGIVHQVNLEYLAKGVLHQSLSQGELYYPDTVLGTDSHTTMVNGLGIVGWGVGGIEAEAGMLGQPVYFLTPEVVGVHLTGELAEGVTATDLALHMTHFLRAAKVVNKFVEFYGQGAAKLTSPDRATIANMAPEYGATMGIFPVDQESVAYFKATGRSTEECAVFENYFKAQGLFGMPQAGDIDYSVDLSLDLGSVKPSVAGPKRPQDQIELSQLKPTLETLFEKNVSEGGYGKSKKLLKERFSLSSGASLLPHDEQEMILDRPTPDPVKQMPESPFHENGLEIHHGSVLIAAITSCTNTSNPSVMLAAGLLAKKAVEYGLRVNPTVKTSLAPGSRVVTHYLQKTGLQSYLDQLGFETVGYGCTTCIGNSGPLHPSIEKAIQEHDLVAAAVLSGNRNFEARIHPAIKANFLMSPPLVVAFALAGRVNIDLATEPVGFGKNKQPVFFRDLWPSLAEIRATLQDALSPAVFQQYYSDFAAHNPAWNEIPSTSGATYLWNEKSTYIQEPPFFEHFSMKPEPIPEITNARALAIFGDSVTTDHISPAGAIKQQGPAGLFLKEQGVKAEDFNSYGSRRGNDRVMTRGTFANVRIKNLILPGVEGGETLHQPEETRMSIYDAALRYAAEKTPLLVIAGQEYGTGSSRDWAAKGTRLLGVRAVIASSYERIHRSNLIGMGVLPLQFLEGISAQSLNLNGTETYDLLGLSEKLQPRQEAILRITRKNRPLVEFAAGDAVPEASSAQQLSVHKVLEGVSTGATTQCASAVELCTRANGQSEEIPVLVRIDTPIEIEYYKHGGILPFILRQLLTA
ncbi:MAG: aconitate hydratase AcnA [Chthoniobacterales bacterium]|nr:aconitate hydratase AcnA [Chthoniobacterales bacterium]